jgi:hypothetical protein
MPDFTQGLTPGHDFGDTKDGDYNFHYLNR